VGQAMTTESAESYYARRTQQELDRTQKIYDPAIKALHLDMAAEYVTRRERSIAPTKNDAT